MNKITKYVPNLPVTKKELESVIKITDDNTLHDTIAKIKTFTKLFETLVKEEFARRIKKFHRKKENKNKPFRTDFGTISLVERANFIYDEEKIGKKLRANKKKLEKNGFDLDFIYKKSYQVVTSNPKAINEMLEKGWIVVKKNIDANKFEKVAVLLPELLDYVENNPTIYIKGL